eukprot:tig00001388_g8583.t1
MAFLGSAVAGPSCSRATPLRARSSAEHVCPLRSSARQEAQSGEARSFFGEAAESSSNSRFFGARPARRIAAAAQPTSRLEISASSVAAESSEQTSQPATTSSKTERVGVLLLNLGGPERLEDVRPFLYNLFADPDIIRLPLPFLQKPLGYLISTVRSKKSQEAYKSIGGGSPIRRITEAQAAELVDTLRERGLKNAKVYVGMRYWHPYTDEAIEEIKRDGITKLVVLPLYPQFSISTSGSSFRQLEKLWQEDPALADIEMTVIPSYPTRAGYVKAQADLIRKELEQFPDPEAAHIFFSAHGVPQSYVEQAGDPYQREVEECVEAIMRELNVENKFTLAYQSRVGPVEWLKPYTEDTIEALGAKGIKDLCVIPISFVSEHIETLEEIDQEYRELAEENGVERWRRVPALDTYPAFIEDLASMVEEALRQPNVSIHDAMDSVRLTVTRKLPMGVQPQSLADWGFTDSAEVINGRLAMIAFVVLISQFLSGHLQWK